MADNNWNRRRSSIHKYSIISSSNCKLVAMWVPGNKSHRAGRPVFGMWKHGYSMDTRWDLKGKPQAYCQSYHKQLMSQNIHWKEALQHFELLLQFSKVLIIHMSFCLLSICSNQFVTIIPMLGKYPVFSYEKINVLLLEFIMVKKKYAYTNHMKRNCFQTVIFSSSFIGINARAASFLGNLVGGKTGTLMLTFGNWLSYQTLNS